MKVSVIIPALNESAAIANAVERAWHAGAFEVVVVDGGSRDDTREIARRERCLLIESERGRAVQQNAGADRARGEVLLFLHADTWLSAGAVDQIVEALADQRILGGAFRQRIEASGRVYRWLERGNAWRVERRGLPYGDQGIFVRREVFFELGRFPPVDLMEDVLLMKKLRRRARPVLLTGPLHVDARRWQKRGVIRQTLRNWTLMAALQFGVSPDRLARFYPPHKT